MLSAQAGGYRQGLRSRPETLAGPKARRRVTVGEPPGEQGRNNQGLNLSRQAPSGSMTSTTATMVSPLPRPAAPLSRAGWIWLGTAGLLFLVLFWAIVQRMAFIALGTSSWWNVLTGHFDISGDWSHAIVIPFISGYFVWQNRERLAAAKIRTFWPGLWLFYAGLFSYAWWLGPGRNDMLQGYSMIVALMGLTWFALGGQALRVLWFPILYLALGIKVAPRWWDALAWQLRLIASRSGTMAVNVLGAPVNLRAEVQGSTIDLWSGLKHLQPPMDVANACSGLRMLMAFIALGVAMAYLVRRLWWQRLIMVLATVPIAVAVNVGRIVVLAFIRAEGNPEAAQGQFHIFVGMLMLIPAAGLFWLLGWVLDHMVVYEDDPAERTPSARAAQAAPPASPAPAAGQCSPGRLVNPLLLGGAMTAMVGASYAAILSVLRPDLLLPKLLDVHTSRLVMGGLLGAALVMLIWVLYRARRLTRTDRMGTGEHLPTLAFSVGLLLVSILGLQSTIALSGEVLFKKPVPLRSQLYTLPDRIGSWVHIHDPKIEQMSEEAIETLGTREFMRYRYRDTSRTDGGPGSEVILHVAYYTGTPDTVPHVPDRCYVAGGLVGIDKTEATLRFQGPQYVKEGGTWIARRDRAPKIVHMPAITAPATVFTFADPHDPEAESNVIYFFVSNGRFLPSPDDVRLYGFLPTDTYAYYCKVEVLVPGMASKKGAVKCVDGFLSEMMPEIMACLPDWVDVRAGRWPAPATQPAPAGLK